MAIKPKKRFYCNSCKRHKMLFQTKEEAERFLKYNTTNPEEWDEKKVPIRSYYCVYCCGWHITSKPTHLTEEEDIKLQNEEIDKMIGNFKVDIKDQDEFVKKDFKDRLKMINLEIEFLKSRLGKEKAVNGTLENLEELNSEVDIVSTRFKELISEHPDIDNNRVRKCRNNIRIVKTKLFNSFYGFHVKEFIRSLKEIDVLIFYGIKESAKDQLETVKKKVRELEEKVGKNEIYSIDSVKDLIKQYEEKIKREET